MSNSSRMPTNNLMEGEDAVENDLDPDNQLTGISRQRIQLSRITIKESTEIDFQPDTEVSEKSAKLINNQRSSNRLNKRLRQEANPIDALKKPAVVKASSTVGSKTRRPWELWSVEDKNAFFEALCEYGKDFESIQSYIAQRSKKKGVASNMIKNKDQVRHFYYRTWHKISKFLEISECVRKQTQELYGLINYAELRKKIGGCLNEKNRQKLNELVFSGVTTVKHKGKKLRIKTPVCRALKKLNNVTDSKEPEVEKLPKDVLVEFRPHNNAAWLQVQNLAQNPRVRTKVCLQKRLKPVIEYLQTRWRSYRLKRKEQILTSLPNSMFEEITCDNQFVLRVKPSRTAKISPLSLSAMDIASSSDVCLENFMKLSHKAVRKDISTGKKICRLKQKILHDKQNDFNEAVSDIVDTSPDLCGECPDTNNSSEAIDLNKFSVKCVPDEINYINVLTPPKSVPESSDSNITAILTSMLDPTNAKSIVADDNGDKEVNEAKGSHTSDVGNFAATESEVFCTHDKAEKDNPAANECDIDMNQQDNAFENNMTLGELLSLNSKKKLLSPDHLSQDKEKGSPENSVEDYESDEIKANSDVYCKIIKNGWTTEEAGFLTFGELYLMLGKPATIVLEYEFVESQTAISHLETLEESPIVKEKVTCALNKVFKIATNLFTEGKKQIIGKQTARTSSKSTKIKASGLSERIIKENSSPLVNPNSDINVSIKDNMVGKDIAVGNPPLPNKMDIPSTTADAHVFVMPVGTAPRTIKPPDQNTLKEEIGKLLPGTRRGCRVRRKPLVVQRPLLPRDGMRTLSGPRPMTVVHFVPSVSPITAVIPSGCGRTENKISIPPAKKVVKILSSGSSIDMHPIQVPVLKQVQTDPGQNVVLQQNSIPASHVLVNSNSGKPIQIINDQNIPCHMTTVNPTIPNSDRVIKSHESVSSLESQSIISDAALSSSSLDALNLDLLSPPHSTKSSEPFTSLSQISIPESSNHLTSSISPTVSTSFLEDFGLSSRKSMLYESTPNSSTGHNTDLLSMPRRCSSPESPTHQPFRINSPEIQWLNGESTELSLNTFLNSMESPCKVTASTLVNLSTENSNLDPIARLAPVVDSQVRCLLDECSIDFITKFEDLADVINNSSSSESKQT